MEHGAGSKAGRQTGRPHEAQQSPGMRAAAGSLRQQGMEQPSGLCLMRPADQMSLLQGLRLKGRQGSLLEDCVRGMAGRSSVLMYRPSRKFARFSSEGTLGRPAG